MKFITIQFPTRKDMWDFLIEVNHIYSGLDFINHTISCSCTDAHIKLAIEKFNGVFVSTPNS